jgi:hypothetical protein
MAFHWAAKTKLMVSTWNLHWFCHTPHQISYTPPSLSIFYTKVKVVFLFIYFLFLLLCWVAFTKFLTIYQKYCTWMHSLCCSPSYSPSPHSWNSFNIYHFFICIHMHTVFAPYFPSTISSHLLQSHWYQPPW